MAVRKKAPPTKTAKPSKKAPPVASKAKAAARRPAKASSAPNGPASRRKAKTASLARDALKAAAMKKTIERVIAPVDSDEAVVAAYLNDLDHPFKAELEAVRSAVLGASKKMAERIKWNALSFYYKDDFAVFNPRASECAHLVVMFPGGVGVPKTSRLLEGKAKDRRDAKFSSMLDVESKRRGLQKLVKEWVAERDGGESAL